MEALPPISEVYSYMKENRDYGVIRKYQSGRTPTHMKVPPTKRKTYLDHAIKMSFSPGPANSSNAQEEWARKKSIPLKHSDRKTYIDDIQSQNKKKNLPSPNHYSIGMPWPEKSKNNVHPSQKISFLDNSEYESTLTPGPGAYIVATKIGKVPKETHKFTENHSKQPRENKAADMTTYDPIPIEYSTFKKLQKMSKSKTQGSIVEKTEKKKKNGKQNDVPGPGQYQIIHTWAKDKKPQKNSSSYLDKISKAPAPTIYYH